MILKKFKRGNFQKTKAAMIGGLVDYVLAHKDEEGNRKQLYAFGMNFLTGTTEAWKREMIALAEESTRSRMPVKASSVDRNFSMSKECSHEIF